MSSEVYSPLIEAAKADAVHASAACVDLHAMLFPKGRHLPSEALQAAVRTKLHDLIVSLESALLQNEETHVLPCAWLQLSQRGEMRHLPIMAFAVSRVSEDAIKSRISENENALLSSLPSRLIGNRSEPVAALARQLLAAEQASHHPSKNLYTLLEPTLLNMLVWEVANVHMETAPEREAAVKLCAQRLLANHQTANQVGIAAQKLLFAIGAEYKAELHDPVRAGFHLYVAELEREFSLSRDSVIRMIDADTAAPFALLLAMRGVSRETAASQIQLLRGRSRDDQELHNILTYYQDFAPANSIELLDDWRNLGGGSNAA